MSVTSKEIRALIDSPMPPEAKEKKLAYWMLSEPVRFWSSITSRMLGAKRLQRLSEVASIMEKSPNQTIGTCGNYLWRVLAAKDQDEEPEWQELRKRQVDQDVYFEEYGQLIKDKKYEEATLALANFYILQKKIEELSEQIVKNKSSKRVWI
jgi:hypothetical protein